jgi:hypothetical protein
MRTTGQIREPPRSLPPHESDGPHRAAGRGGAIPRASSPSCEQLIATAKRSTGRHRAQVRGRAPLKTRTGIEQRMEELGREVGAPLETPGTER